MQQSKLGHPAQAQVGCSRVRSSVQREAAVQPFESDATIGLRSSSRSPYACYHAFDEQAKQRLKPTSLPPILSFLSLAR